MPASSKFEALWHLFWISIGLIFIFVSTYRLWGIDALILAIGVLIMIDEALNRLSGVYGTDTD